MKTNLFFLLLPLFILSACTSVPVTVYKNESPKLVLENYLAGPSTAYGVFTDRSGQVKKRFICEAFGEWKNEVLTLTENFKYSDGTTSQRIWKVKKISENRYEGTAGDVVGVAVGESSGNAFHWTYTMALDVDGKVYNVHFDDWMYLMDGKVMLNRSAMSKWGFHLGDVTLSFVKP